MHQTDLLKRTLNLLATFVAPDVSLLVHMCVVYSIRVLNPASVFYHRQFLSFYQTMMQKLNRKLSGSTTMGFCKIELLFIIVND